MITNKYDLEERTAKFSQNVISFCKIVPVDIITKPLISQLIRSATSVGANYYEANGASSRKDFVSKIYISKKEAKETQYWLRILSFSLPMFQKNIKSLWQEAKELAMIFSTIASKSKSVNNSEVLELKN